MTGVSVRTLHYYDEIGLLAPADRTSAGYRLYDDDSLLRLQQILIGRALGLSLDEIRRSLDDPDFDHRAALVSQRQALVARAEETAGMIRAVDKALAILDEDRKDSEMTMEQIFEGFDPKAYGAEADARWGDTDAYKTASRRTKDYTEEDWKRIKAEQAAIYDALATLMQEGDDAEGVAAMELAERHRLSIDRWFYPCSHDAHAGLADLYEADGRFAETIDKHGDGLTPYLAAAIRANARRVTGG